MKATGLIATLVLAGAVSTAALAQVPPSNATVQGTQGPNSNSNGYPSAGVQPGQLNGSGSAPSVAPSPGNVAAGQPTPGTANSTGTTPGTPK